MRASACVSYRGLCCQCCVRALDLQPPNPLHLSPGLTTLATIYRLHLSLDLSSQLVLLGIGPDLLLWFLDIFYLLFLGQISPIMYLVFLKNKIIVGMAVTLLSQHHLPEWRQHECMTQGCPVTTTSGPGMPTLSFLVGY